MDGLDHSPRSHLDDESRHILMGFFGGFRFTECMKKKIIKKTTLQRQGNSTTMLSKGYASLSGVIWPVMTPWISPQMRFVFCENNNQMSERIYLCACLHSYYHYPWLQHCSWECCYGYLAHHFGSKWNISVTELPTFLHLLQLSMVSRRWNWLDFRYFSVCLLQIWYVEIKVSRYTG